MAARKPQRYASLVGSIVLALFWATQGVLKLLNVNSFSPLFAAYSPINVLVAPYLVILVGLGEIALGVWFLRCGQRSGTPYVFMAGCLVFFSALGSYEYLMGNIHHCGCGLFGSSMNIGPMFVARNLALMCITYLGIRLVS